MERNHSCLAADKKRKTAIRIVSALLVLLLISLGVLVYAMFQSYVSRYRNMNQNEITKQDIDLLPVEYVSDVKQIEKTQDTFNILLFGLDVRDKSSFDRQLSDVMILMTVEPSKQSIKMVSFMRDCLVKIPGHPDNRLNTPFRFGGAELAIRTFQNNFGIDVDWYAVINFWSMAEMIDALGGIELDLSSGEVEQLNISLKEINAEVDAKERAHNITSAGLNKLNGKQAVAFMRIRHLAGSDFKRTERQRIVLKSLFAAVKKMTPDQMIALVDLMPSYVRTNIPLGEMTKMAKAVYSLRGSEINELRIPVEKGYSNYDSMLKLDFAMNNEALQQFLND